MICWPIVSFTSGPCYLAIIVIAGVVTNFAITVELSGRTKNQHVLVHCGPRTIFG